TLTHRPPASRLAAGRGRQLPRRPSQWRALAGTDGGSRYATRDPRMRGSAVAHARSLRLRVGRRGRQPELAARGLPRGHRGADRRGQDLRLQLLAPGTRRGWHRRRSWIPGHLPTWREQARAALAAVSRERHTYPLRGPVPGRPGLRPDYLRRRRGPAARRTGELPARRGGRRRLAESHPRGARRGPAGQHPLAAGPAIGPRAHQSYLRSPAAGGRARRLQTIEVPPGSGRGSFAADRGRQGSHFDPYAFVPKSARRTG